MQSMVEKSRCKRIRKSFVLWSGLFVCQTYRNAKWQLYVYIFSASIRPTNVPKSSLQSCNYWAHSSAYCNWSLLQIGTQTRKLLWRMKNIQKMASSFTGLPKFWYLLILKFGVCHLSQRGIVICHFSREGCIIKISNGQISK